jgi:hypothetical protein
VKGFQIPDYYTMRLVDIGCVSRNKQLGVWRCSRAFSEESCVFMQFCVEDRKLHAELYIHTSVSLENNRTTSK